MMDRKKLISLIKKKRSFLCVGLDTDISKIPPSLLSADDPVFEFNKKIIDATLPFTVAYKPNIAFYEALGSKGFYSLEKTIEYINQLHEKVFTIADAKRGDIGNSAERYAQAFFESMGFDAVTVSPYMGFDSVDPFLRYNDKWTILLALTSNKGSDDFQMLPVTALDEENNMKGSGAEFLLYQEVMRKSLSWPGSEKLMFVIGATQATKMKEIRALAPDSFFLVPGVGAQGGSLKDVADNSITKDCGLLINASRSIIYASDGPDFAEMAAAEAETIQKEMERILTEKGII